MNKILKAMMIASLFSACVSNNKETAGDDFEYNNERFADLQMLRYKVEGFDDLTLKQKTFIYYLSEAALWGRDILWDQNGKYNLRIRHILERIYTAEGIDHTTDDWRAFETYIKRVWFSNGIHHHYGSEKFVPGFSQEWLDQAVATALTAAECHTTAPDITDIKEVIFNPEVLPKLVNLAEGADLLLTSASNYYDGVTQAEAEAFYENLKKTGDQAHPVMWGMNSRLVKNADGTIVEKPWTTEGLYGAAIKKVVENLRLARPFAEDEAQQHVIDLLIAYYESGDLKTFDDYTIAWVDNTAPIVDFVNGFTESYGDPLGMKASWESIVNFKDVEATKRTEKLSDNAQWFEDHSPIAAEFKKEKVKGVTAKVVKAAILAGDLYPSTAIGINLPNSDWVRAEHGSKSVTIANLTDAYAKAAKGSGMLQEFTVGQEEIDLITKYGD
ncbi:MAG: dihydrofolate reductase, partial [Bacteroidaceae bacterium]|nr:dihydrofolate reductase [Bacteroidaceae bacterium]